MHSFSPTAPALLNRAIARIVGREASILSYPLIEMLRTCKLQTRGRGDCTRDRPLPIDSVVTGSTPPVDRMSRVSGNLHYSSAWLWLAEGARRVVLPPSAIRTGCTYLLSFYDAFGEHIASIGDAEARDAGVIVHSPHTAPGATGPDFHVIHSPTDLVWMIGRILDSPHEPRQHVLFQSTLHIDGPPGTLAGRRPAALDLWEGDVSDPFVDLVERQLPGADLAPAFFANMCRALAHIRVPSADRPLISALRMLGLETDCSAHWNDLPASVREGLTLGLVDAAQAVSASAAQPVHSAACGRPTRRECRLTRAVRAYKGLCNHAVEAPLADLVAAASIRGRSVVTCRPPT